MNCHTWHATWELVVHVLYGDFGKADWHWRREEDDGESEKERPS